MRRIFYAIVVSVSTIFSSCSNEPGNAQEITVAAAANLNEAFDELAKRFTAEVGIRVVYSFGSTADLTKQIENGAPFDVFASADVEHIDDLNQKGMILPDTQARYARGRLVLWAPPQSGVDLNRIEDVTRADVKTIAIAKPELAPYGRATVEALKSLGLWGEVERKAVYGPNVSITKQYATSGNANMAFIPLALVKEGDGKYIEVDEHLHQPIEQALAVIKSSSKKELARSFVNYVLGPRGREILHQYGYRSPTAP